MRDALQHVMQFEYDKLGRRIWRILPVGMTETNFYDAVGNVVTNFDFNGHMTVFQYDAMNRLTQKTPDAAFNQSPITFTYYPTGVRSTMVDNVGTTTYTYDSRNRLLSKSIAFYPAPGGASLSLSYAYDFNGNLTKIQSGAPSNGTVVAYEYDALNRLARVIDTHRSQNLVTTNSYDAVGNLAGYVTPNNMVSSYRYDGLNRLTNMTVRVGTTGTNIYNYTLGPAGNRTAVSEVIKSVRTRQVSYDYDALYRLTNETISADNGGPTGTICYQYDDVGNRTNRSSSVQSVPSADYSYDSNDRLNSDSYDANGNTTSSGGNTDHYDFENRLTNRNSAVYLLYDGDGHRVGKSAAGTNTIYLVDDKNPTGYAQVLEEYESVSAGSTNLVRVYTYGLDLISLDRNYSGTSWTIRYYGYDGHGNTRLLTLGGVSLDSYTYDAFGVVLTNTGSSFNNYLYCGEQYDQNLGFYYLRARYMNPVTGRFWTMDTFEGNPEEPASLNRYIYCRNDGINRIDPSGHDDIASVMVSMEIFGILAATPNLASAQKATAPVRWGTWYIREHLVNLTGPDVSTEAIVADENGFWVTYTPGPDDCKQGKIVLYQIISRTGIISEAPHVDHVPPVSTPAHPLPPAMGPIADLPTSYYDSPSGGGAGVSTVRLTAVAVCRTKDEKGGDRLLSTYYFEFNNATRKITKRDPDYREHYHDAMKKWWGGAEP